MDEGMLHTFILFFCLGFQLYFMDCLIKISMKKRKAGSLCEPAYSISNNLKAIYYLAYSITLISLITLTLISPGYFRSVSIF